MELFAHYVDWVQAYDQTKLYSTAAFGNLANLGPEAAAELIKNGAMVSIGYWRNDAQITHMTIAELLQYINAWAFLEQAIECF